MHFGFIPFGFIDYIIIPFCFYILVLCVMLCTGLNVIIMIFQAIQDCYTFEY